MPDHKFDIELYTSVTVTADTEEAARQMIIDRMENVEANFGSWENGDPILGEIGIVEDGITTVESPVTED